MLLLNNAIRHGDAMQYFLHPSDNMHRAPIKDINSKDTEAASIALLQLRMKVPALTKSPARRINIPVTRLIKAISKVVKTNKRLQ